VDGAVAGHHAVAEVLLVLEPEVGGAVDDEAVQLHERALVQEHVEPLARGELAALVLRLDALAPAAHLRLAAHLLQLLQLSPHRHADARPCFRVNVGAPGTAAI
jgi:hypothetical protein